MKILELDRDWLVRLVDQLRHWFDLFLTNPFHLEPKFRKIFVVVEQVIGRAAASDARDQHLKSLLVFQTFFYQLWFASKRLNTRNKIDHQAQSGHTIINHAAIPTLTIIGHRILTHFVRGSFTVRLTFCFICLDSVSLLMLN